MAGSLIEILDTPKPAVHPKPVLNQNLGFHIPENQRKMLPNHANIKVQNIANNAEEQRVRVKGF